MSASDPRTDSCMEWRAGDYCHRHVSFLLTLAPFTGTDYPTFETTVASQFVLDFLHEIRFLHKCKNLTLGPRKIKTTFWNARDFPQCCQVGDATSEVNPSLHFYSVVFPLRRQRFLLAGQSLGRRRLPRQRHQSQWKGCCLFYLFIWQRQYNVTLCVVCFYPGDDKSTQSCTT